MTLQRLLTRLADPAWPIDPSQLVKLSGLLGPDLELVRERWQQIPVERRRTVVRWLVDLAEDNIDLDYTAVFHLALADPDAAVRLAAVEGLCEDESRTTALALLRLLKDDPDPEVRAAAASGLGRFVYLIEFDRLDRRTADLVREGLLAVIRDPAEPLVVRRRAVEAIAYLSRPEVTAIIESAYRDSDVRMRASALFAMGRNCDPRWLEVLLRELQSPLPELRFEAARACGELSERRAVPHLVPVARGDADREVQLAAIAALGQIGGRLARQTLLELRQAPDPEVREAAAEALEELDGWADPLAFHFYDPEPN